MRQQAFEYLEKAYADGDSEMLFVIRNPASTRSAPTPLKDLMRRLGCPSRVAGISIGLPVNTYNSICTLIY